MTPARPYAKARQVNSSSANFPTWVTSELADPLSYYADAGTAAGRAIKPLAVGLGGVTPCRIVIVPYGLGSDNDVFSINVVGVRRIAEPIDDGRVQFLRSLVAVLSCTISASVGIAGGKVLATERFADTISITKEGTYTADVTRTGTIDLFSPANDSPGHAIVPLLGFEGYELEFDQTTGTPTMNALVSFLDGDD